MKMNIDDLINQKTLSMKKQELSLNQKNLENSLNNFEKKGNNDISFLLKKEEPKHKKENKADSNKSNMNKEHLLRLFWIL